MLTLYKGRSLPLLIENEKKKSYWRADATRGEAILRLSVIWA